MPARSTLQVEGFFDEATSTVSYIVLDQATMQCAIGSAAMPPPR